MPAHGVTSTGNLADRPAPVKRGRGASDGPPNGRHDRLRNLPGPLYWVAMEGSGKPLPPGSPAGAPSPQRKRDNALYFFPDRDVTDEELRALLREGGEEQRAWAISHLLRYAQWEDIWTYVDRDEVREIFPALDLPDNLRQAWGRMLKVEAPVG